MLVLAHGSMVIFMTSISSVITMNITRILKIVVKIFGRALLCQQCANVSACNLKIEVIDRISKRFTTGKALSVCFPRVVAKNILFTLFCFVCTFLRAEKSNLFLLMKAILSVVPEFEGDFVHCAGMWRASCLQCLHMKAVGCDNTKNTPAFHHSL